MVGVLAMYGFCFVTKRHLILLKCKNYAEKLVKLFKKRTSLMTPIQDEIYNAVKDLADQRGYSLVVDRASDSGIIYGSPKIDISNEVLQKLGYSNQ